MSAAAGLIVRPAADSDLAAITGIYCHHVLNGLASFETEPPDAAEMARRHAAVVAHGLPFIVADTAGAVAGYAYAALYRARPAYRYTVEDSVYIDRAHTGRGVGSALLRALIAGCEAAGRRQMIAVIGDSANSASIRLHAKLGFQHIGTLPAVGHKFDRWVDSVLMQRALGAGDRHPPA